MGKKEIIRLAALFPEYGCRPIATHFNRLYEQQRDMTVGKTFVANTLSTYQYQILCTRRSIKQTPAKTFPANQQ